MKKKAKWTIATKRADFYGLARQLQTDPVVVRIMRNRGLTTKEEMESFMHSDLSEIRDPWLLKDVEKAADIIYGHIRDGHKMMIANDFDCDGISSGYILLQCLKNLGADVYVDTPDRCIDGYGINERMVRDAYEHNVKLIITCDNGISALRAAALAEELGIEMVITDHHECPFEEVDGERVLTLPAASAIIDPKQPDCPYPFDGICGAVVAFKLMQVLYMKYSSEHTDRYVWNFMEIAAVATVVDVMPLQDENRALVRAGLKKLSITENVGLQALIEINNLKNRVLTAYHLGFVIGPCLNSSGRLASAKMAVELLCEQDHDKAMRMASELKELNDARKAMTQAGALQAERIVEAGMSDDKVLVLLLENCHESLAGIIAGRIKEAYHRPVLVFTETENGLKGSGRSMDYYNMFEKVNVHKHMLNSFGGHPMACGLSIDKDKLDEFRRLLNEDSGITEDDLTPELDIDTRLPVWYLNDNLIEQINALGPFGNGNKRPLFADRNLQVIRAEVKGKTNSVLKLCLRDERGMYIDAVFFDGPEPFEEIVKARYGEEMLKNAYFGKPNDIRLTVAYIPKINEYRGQTSIEMEIRSMKVTVQE